MVRAKGERPAGLSVSRAAHMRTDASEWIRLLAGKVPDPLRDRHGYRPKCFDAAAPAARTCPGPRFRHEEARVCVSVKPPCPSLSQR